MGRFFNLGVANTNHREGNCVLHNRYESVGDTIVQLFFDLTGGLVVVVRRRQCDGV